MVEKCFQCYAVATWVRFGVAAQVMCQTTFGTGRMGIRLARLAELVVVVAWLEADILHILDGSCRNCGMSVATLSVFQIISLQTLLTGLVSSHFTLRFRHAAHCQLVLRIFKDCDDVSES